MGRARRATTQKIPSLRVAIAVLSAPNERHHRLRCFQRQSLFAGVAYVPPRAAQPGNRRGWLSLYGGGTLMLRYIISRPVATTSLAALEHEDSNHGDLVLTSIVDGTQTCFSKVAFSLRQLASVTPRPHFITILDDDVFLHPTRLAQDLIPLIDHGREVFYGQIAFAAGWSNQSLRQYGYGMYNVDAQMLFDRWRKKRVADPGHGPFPVAYGYAMTVSLGLALRVSTSQVVANLEREVLQRVHRARLNKRPTGAWQV